MKRILFIFVAVLLVGGMSSWAGGQGDETAAAPTAVRTGKYGEAPMLAELVAAGALPPVEERLPKEPPVALIVDEIGQYGGTVNVFAVGGHTEFADQAIGGPRILRMGFDGTIYGDIAKDWSFSDDFMTLEITLREGVKWSDGVEVTSNDAVFVFNDMHNHADLKTWNFLGPTKEATKIDEYSYRIDYRRPTPNAIQRLCGSGGAIDFHLTPKHYLQKWHIDYNEEAEKLAVDEGFNLWHEAMYHHYWWSPRADHEKPTLSPWVVTKADSTVKVMERNPYYLRIDPAGNQLPYIDGAVAQYVDKEVFNLKIVSGECDVAFLNTKFENFTLFKENEGEGDYAVYPIQGTSASNVSIVTNWNHKDPLKRELTHNAKFKQALSLAINRDEINIVAFKGMGVPRQATVVPKVSYYDPKWAEAYAEYDPAKANQLLDEIGLDKKDKDGFRLRPDNGETMQWVLEYSTGSEGAGTLKTLELIKEYWTAIGINILVKGFDQKYFREREHQALHDIKVRATAVDNHMNVGHWASQWNSWINANLQIQRGEKKLEDFKDGVLPGEEAPQWVQDYRALFDRRNEVLPDSPEYKAALTKAMDMQAENLFLIGTVGLTPVLMIAKNNMGNIFTKLTPRAVGPGHLQEWEDQFYIKK
jgi:peptide/nickel transport system substrate-binding protein